MTMYLKIRVDTSEKLNNIRGVFADADISADEIIEVCPVILVPDSEMENLSKTVMTKYEFEWDETTEAVVLGYGSLYNHSETPNVEFDKDYGAGTMVFTAMCDIKKDEELYIDYMQGTEGESIPEEYLDYKH